jgi:hypothetical protein
MDFDSKISAEEIIFKAIFILGLSLYIIAKDLITPLAFAIVCIVFPVSHSDDEFLSPPNDIAGYCINPAIFSGPGFGDSSTKLNTRNVHFSRSNVRLIKP